MNNKEKRNFLLTLAGKGVSLAGTSLYSFAISFYILTITGSAQSFALSLTLSMLPKILFSPFAGNLVDRLNKKLIVVVSDTLSGLVMLVLFFLTGSKALSLPMIYTATVIMSILIVFLNTAFSASYATIVSKDNIIKINSYQQTLDAFIQFASPILGGIIYAIIDIRIFLLINAISFLISAFTELFIDFTYYSGLKGIGREKNRFFKDMQEGFSYLIKQKAYLSLMLYAFFINFFLGTFSVVMPYDLLTNLKLSSSSYGMINACFPIGMMLMSIYVGKRRLAFSKKLFRNAMALMGISMLSFAIPVMESISLGSLTIPYYIVAMMFLSGVLVTVQIPISVLSQTTIEEAYRGRVSGSVAAVSQGIIPLAYIITGILVDITPTYLILSVVGVILMFIALLIHNNQIIGQFDQRLEAINP